MLLVSWSFPPGVLSQDETETGPQTLRIGVLQDGDWELLDELLALIQQELAILTAEEFVVAYPEQSWIDADWNLIALSDGFEELLSSPDVDLVITLGLAGSQMATSRTSGYPKPVLAPLTIDAEIQGLPRRGAGSGVPNLTYVAIPNGLENDLAVFRKIAPFDHLTLVVNREFLSTAEETIAATTEAALGARISYVAAERTADGVLEQLSPETQAVYLWPLLMEKGELAKLIDELNRRKLPTFSAVGREHMEVGVLATMAPDESQQRLARRAALNIHRILLGEDPAEIPVFFRQPERLLLNMQTLRVIDASPRWEILLEAERMNDEDPSRPRLTLSTAVERAVAANLDLSAEEAAVRSGVESVRVARSQLGPQLKSSLTGLQVDSETAANSFGSQPQRTLDAGLSLSQILYSNGAFGNFAIERDLQEGRAAAYEALRLDIALDAATAYIALLRTQNLRAVQRENLRVTRANLELAETRREVGSASSSEILRWRSQIAGDRQSLVAAEADVRTAAIALNRILHNPIELDFLLEDLAIDDPTLMADQRFRGYIETPKHFETFRTFAVERALERAPELEQLDRSIAAQDRVLQMARRSYWTPDVALQADLSDRLAESGTGSDLDVSADDSSWSVAVNASLSLFESGGRRAKVAQARADLEQLQRTREATAERVEEAVRSAMFATRASFTNVDLAQQALDAATQSLALVQDAYARGAVSILDLLDAQNAALQAETGATDAIYGFFTNLLTVQRTTNQFDFFVDRAARQQWYDQLEAFFLERGVERWQFE